MKIKYDDSFYKVLFQPSYKSAKAILDHFSLNFKPESVIDVGCGRGAWLKIFKEQGTPTLFGLDGPWNNQKKMITKDIEFISTELEKPFKISRKFDVAICVEVAEHLSQKVAKSFVKNLTNLSDVIIFGAASPFQGGVDHLNEKFPSYWAAIFNSLGYDVYDYFRPTISGNKKVLFFYQQNTFLYVKRKTTKNFLLSKLKFNPITNYKFMDYYHPLMILRISKTIKMIKKIKSLISNFVFTFFKINK